MIFDLNIFLLILSLVVISSCEINNSNLNSDCKYENTTWIIVKDATCTRKCLQHNECIDCGKKLKTEKFNALGHDYVNGVCTRCGDEKELHDEIIIDGNYIYFGEYPQTLKESSVTITRDTPDVSGYYLGSDGERYAKAEIIIYPHINIIYFNNNTIIEYGKSYYFKVEPIKWQILESNNGTYKLVSDLILDNQKNSSDNDRTIDGKTIYPNNYEYSGIRKWLNEEFYNQVFTTELKSYINTTHIDNSLESTGYESNPYICKDTNDKVYLLSYTEITNKDYGFESDSNRCKQLTDYAKAKGCLYNNEYYWLRSPFNYNNHASYVSYDGYIDYYWVDGDSIGVVVAITVTI